MCELKDLQIRKRDGRLVKFRKDKIVNAALAAFKDVDGSVDEYALDKSDKIADYIAEKAVENPSKILDIEEIQNMVENGLANTKRKDVAFAFHDYRVKRTNARKNTIDDEVMEIVDATNDYWESENANKNPRINSTQRDYMAGSISADLTKRYLLSDDIVKADKEGLLHFHDKDYFAQREHNCDLINLDDMLQNGTAISETLIEKPKSFTTACTVATQIIAQVASNQYGGQSISLEHLAPFIDVSRKKLIKKEKEDLDAAGIKYTEEQIKTIVERKVKEIVKDGAQTIQYQLITFQTTNGQAPFITIFMYLNEARDEQTKKDLAMLIEEMLKQRIQGVKNREGHWIAPAFPKLIYVLEDDNCDESQPYWYLTQLAAECSSKRLVPDYISEKKMLEIKGDVYTCMGCRSFLTPDNPNNKEGLCNKGNKANAKNYKEGDHKYYGRFNQGVVTINLPDIAFSSGRDEEKFWKIFDERTELCHKALQFRHKRLMGTSTQVAPILWQDGALARLSKDETIDKLLVDNYSTISLGFCGLYECVKYMTGHSHSDEGIGKTFGIKVMKALNDKCSKWREAEHVSYSLYGTPMESTTYKLATCLKERFGKDIFVKLDGKDRNYITNSYHIPVFEEIDAFDKLRIESEFQELAPGGAISYIETPDMTHNIPALLEVIKYMYQNIMYAEINTKNCYCEKCGYDGNIPIVKDTHGKLIWKCPNCGNEDSTKMDIAFRVCGYIGTAKNGANQGRMGDIHDRVYHIDDKEFRP